jgi:hypothetical protein
MTNGPALAKEMTMTKEHTIGDRVRVVDEELDNTGAGGTVIATDDAGRQFVSIDGEPVAAQTTPFERSQLAPDEQGQTA